MENIQISELHFLIFIIPGFLMVWCFRKFTHKEIKSDFELIGLSVFWGLINLLLWELINKKETVAKMFENVYSAAFFLCLFGILCSYISSWVALQEWWSGLKKILKPKPIKFIQFIKNKFNT
jgi:hypothetical protein